MTSPAETHRDMEYERSRREYRDLVERRLDYLQQMVRGPGLGRTGDSPFSACGWTEAEITRHLNAAWELLQLERMRLK